MLVAGAASQKYMQKLADQQEVMGAIADMVIEAFAMDSACSALASTVEANGEAKAALMAAMTQVYLEGAFIRSWKQRRKKSSLPWRKATCCAPRWRLFAAWPSMSQST